MPDLEFEKQYAHLGIIIGVDEAGRGPLAGPVSVGAAIIPVDFKHPLIDDSKKLTEKRRELLFDELSDCDDIQWAVSIVGADEVDEVNVLRATHLGMARSVATLDVNPGMCLIDGLSVPNFPYPHIGIVKGDSKSLSIATASIFAKVVRDRIMRDAAIQFPGYGFERHKGYGTQAHLEALGRLGPCQIHRRSFQPVAQLLLPPRGDEPS
ncbi:MAG: ribonuclease HII [Akkermansiaceae bacterium]|jgi:ribonuclease HII